MMKKMMISSCPAKRVCRPMARAHNATSGGRGSRTARKQVPDGGAKWCPPYRLPRITPRTPDAALANEFADNNDDVDKVWGRFGYEHIIRYIAQS